MIQLEKVRKFFTKEDLGSLLKRTADWMEKFSVAAAAFYFLQTRQEIPLNKAISIAFGFLVLSYLFTLLGRRFK